MISDEDHGDGKRVRRAGSASLAVWIAVILFGNAAGAAIFVAMAGVELDLPIRRLWIPYAALFDCGLVLAPLLYWAALSRERPKSCAIRSAIAMFLYIQTVMLALGFSTIKLGILSRNQIIDGYAPFMEAFSVIASILIYTVARRMLRAHQTIPVSANGPELPKCGLRSKP